MSNAGSIRYNGLGNGAYGEAPPSAHDSGKPPKKKRKSISDLRAKQNRKSKARAKRRAS